MASQGLRKGNHCAYDLHYHCAYDLHYHFVYDLHYHCAYDLHYHFVFVVRYRRALLRPEVEAELVRLSHETEGRRSATATRSTSRASGPTRTTSTCCARPIR